MGEKKLCGVRPSFQTSQDLQDRPVCTDLYRALLASVPVHHTSFPALIHIGRRPMRHVREETQRPLDLGRRVDQKHVSLYEDANLDYEVSPSITATHLHAPHAMLVFADVFQTPYRLHYPGSRRETKEIEKVPTGIEPRTYRLVVESLYARTLALRNISSHV